MPGGEKGTGKGKGTKDGKGKENRKGKGKGKPTEERKGKGKGNGKGKGIFIQTPGGDDISRAIACGGREKYMRLTWTRRAN